MRQIFLASLYMIFILSTQSCMSFVSSSFQMTNNRFQAPETSGGLGDGIVAAGFASKSTVILTDPTGSTDQEIIDASEVKSTEGFLLQVSAGLHSKLDVIFYEGATGAKFQVLGAPASQAKVGNFSLALGVAGGRGSSESRGYKSTTKVEYSGIDTMILAGYRLQDDQLIYANLASSKFKAEGSVTRILSTGSGNTTSAALKTPERIVRETSLLLGWQAYQNQAYMMLEAGYTFAGLEGKNRLGRLTLGGTIGVNW